jgi:transcriptional regulator
MLSINNGVNHRGDDYMLDERQLKCIALKAQGIEVTKIALEVGISRTTYYEWNKLEDFKAEACRREQEFISSTKQAVISYGPKAMQLLKDLAENADSEKVRLDAIAKILDKIVSNATKIDINDGRSDKDKVSIDVLDQVFKDADNE